MVLGSRGHVFSFNNSNPLGELSVPNNYKSAKCQTKLVELKTIHMEQTSIFYTNKTTVFHIRLLLD